MPRDISHTYIYKHIIEEQILEYTTDKKYIGYI